MQNSNKETALHLCCGKEPQADLAKMLVLCGASTEIKNALGDTPVSLAKRCGNHDLALLLSSSQL